MAQARIPYRKLSRRRRGLTGSAQLWHGGDHLLLVQRHWWLESYQRFRLAQIHSIVVSERPSWLGVRVTLLLMNVLALLLALPLTSSWSRFFWSLALGIPLLTGIVDLSRGRYCRVQLNTAVSSVRIPALSRMRAARRFLERFEPLIAAAQGALAEPSAAPPPLPEAGFVSAGGEPAQKAAPPDLPDRGRPAAPALIFFGTMLASAALSLISLSVRLPAALSTVPWFLAFTAVAIGIHLMASLYRQGPPLFRLLVLLGFLVTGVDLIFSSGAALEGLAALIKAGPAAQAKVTNLWQNSPAWFIRYNQIVNPWQILIAAVGLVAAWPRREGRPAA